MRLVEVHFPGKYREQLEKYAGLAEAIHCRLSDEDAKGRCTLRAVFASGETQEFVDAIQSLFEEEKDWRMIVLPVEATAPKLDESLVETEKKRKATALREEIYHDTAAGATLNADFLILTALSTIVAAIGLSTNNIAVVIGAMVIAPLLGPIVAFSFAAAIGDLKLLSTSARTAVVGLMLGSALSVCVGAFFPVDFQSAEMTSRTAVGLDTIALALASGAAAALSIAAGLPSALVGVMVAVALLPPAAAAGMFLGGGVIESAFRASMLLAVNVVCVNLAALLIFGYKGIRPRTWLERISADRARRVYVGVLLLMLSILTGAIFVLN